MIPNSTLPLKLWYAGSIGSLGAFPFIAVILTDNGWEPTGIAALMALFPMCSMVTAPMWSIVADVSGKGNAILRFATLLQLLGFTALYLFIDTPAAVVTAILLLAAGRAPMSPLSDAMTLAVLGPDANNYGAIRTWGSVAFLVVALLSGYIRNDYSNAPLLFGIGLTILTVCLAWALPTGTRDGEEAQFGALKKMLKRPLLGLLLVLATVHGVTLTTYDNLFGLHVEGLGYSSTFIGLGLGLGVCVEIVILGFGRPILNRMNPLTLMWIGVCSGVPRWWLTATASSGEMLVATQALHGLGYGAFWIGGVALFARLAPKNFERSAQAILPTTTWGVGCIIAMVLASSLLRVMSSAHLFILMSGLSLVASLGMGVVWRQQHKLLGYVDE